MLIQAERNFLNTLNVSCYSLTAICQRASKLMTNGGQILTLSYLGAESNAPLQCNGCCKVCEKQVSNI